MSEYKYLLSKRVFRGKEEISPKDFSSLTKRVIEDLICKGVIKSIKTKQNGINKNAGKESEDLGGIEAEGGEKGGV